MNYIVTSLFTTCVDPQRNIKWEPNIETLIGWYSSGVENICSKNPNTHLLLFYDVLPESFVEYYTSLPYIILIKTPDCNQYSPHDFRWFVYQEFLKDNYDDIENIFFTDAQDVLIQSNPFNNIESNILYCGDEWMHPWENEWAIPRNEYYIYNIPEFLELYQIKKHHLFLNAGLLGGNRKIVLEFLNHICYYTNKTLLKPYNTTDMIIFNYVIHKYFPERVKHGEPVNSKFKQHEYSRKDIWFTHQ